MLVHLRRSFIIGRDLSRSFFGFVYALAGTGVAQLLFKHQADGSITANGSTLIGQNWSATKCPGHPLGSWCSRAVLTTSGPMPPIPKPRRRSPEGTTRSWPTATAASRGRSNLGPRSKVLLTQHPGAGRLLAQAGRQPHSGPGHHLGQRLRPRHHPGRRQVQIPMVSRATGIAPSALRALIARETNGAQLGFLGSSYIDVLQLNEALANLH